MTGLTRMLFSHFGVSLDFKTVGRMTLAFEYPEADIYFYLHALPDREFWIWGHKAYEGQPMHDFGFGPLLLISWWGIG